MAGNSNSGSHKDKLFRKALMMELKIRDADEDMKTLRAIASGVLNDALSGDKDARNMVADRIDGKPAQALVGGDDDDNPIKIVGRIENIIVDANTKDSDS